MTADVRLASIQIGRIAPLGPDGVPSGFVKTAVNGAVAVTMLGLAGDEQADLTVHGGPEKAVYGYQPRIMTPGRRITPNIARCSSPAGSARI